MDTEKSHDGENVTCDVDGKKPSMEREQRSYDRSRDGKKRPRVFLFNGGVVGKG